MSRRTCTVLLAAILAGPAAAQTPAPPPPATYQVFIRYEINAVGLDRITLRNSDQIWPLSTR